MVSVQSSCAGTHRCVSEAADCSPPGKYKSLVAAVHLWCKYILFFLFHFHWFVLMYVVDTKYTVPR